MFKRLKAHRDFVLFTLDPALTIGNGVEQIYVFIFVLIKRQQPLDYLLAGIPDTAGCKIKQILTLIADALKTAIVFQ